MKKFIIALVVGLLFFALGKLFFTLTQAKLIGVVAFLVTLWSNEGLELGVVSMLPLILFPSFGIIDFDTVSPNYAKPIIFLFLGGFLIAIGLQKTGLHIIIAHKILGLFPKTSRGIIYALAITAALLSGVLSNTTTTILLVPIAMFLSSHRRLQLRFVLAIAYGATIGGILTPIGTAPNLILLQFLQDHGLQEPAFFEWIIRLLPVVFVMLAFMPWYLARGVVDLSIDAPEYEKKPLTLDQKKVLTILLGLVLILFVNSPMKPLYDGLGLNERMLLLGAGLLLFAPKIEILNWEDTKEVPYSIIFLFGASFSIAAAFSHTHLGEALATPILHLSALPWLVLLLSVAFLVAFFTEVTSNTALISIALPIFFTFAQTAGLDAATLMTVAAIASSYAFMLPIATPPNAIAMSTGVIHIKEMVKIGVFLNIAGVIVLAVVARFLWS